MTVKEYLNVVNDQLEYESNERNYDDCEVVSYKSEVKIRLPDGRTRVYNSEFGNSNKNQQELEQSFPHKGVKGMLKGIICLIFGHDWVDYNEHCYICSRCMEVAPKG